MLTPDIQPFISCFPSQLEAEVFGVATNTFMVNLPADLSAFSPFVYQDLERQVDSIAAEVGSLAIKCGQGTGDALGLLGKL
jgi:hypothetical protein